MRTKGSLLGKLGCVCFMLVWISIPLLGAISILESGFGTIFAIIPLGMVGIGIIVLIAILTGKTTSGSDTPPIDLPVTVKTTSTRYYPESSTYGSTRTSGPVIYGAPTKCPNCGAPLSDEEIEWVGPLKLMCPSCGFTLDAEKRIL